MRPLLVLCVCLTLLVPLQGWLNRQSRPTLTASELPYLRSGRALKGFSFGFHSLLADLYWLRAIQYFGGKFEKIQAVERGQYEALPDLLNVVTELDPQHVAAYRFGAAFLPTVAPAAAVAFAERGIRDNPREWRLYLDLGYIYWWQKNYPAAALAYEQGSRIADAPAWLPVLAATLRAQGGTRDAARAIFQRLAETTADEFTREISLARLQALRALDEIDTLNARLAVRCVPPTDIDPAGVAYAFDASQCIVRLAANSPLQRWVP